MHFNDSLLQLAREAAIKGGLRLRDRHGRPAGEIHYKEDGSPVTEADLAADAAIRSVLDAGDSGTSYLSEETQLAFEKESARPVPQRYWLVDPGGREVLSAIPFPVPGAQRNHGAQSKCVPIGPERGGHDLEGSIYNA